MKKRIVLFLCTLLLMISYVMPVMAAEEGASKTVTNDGVEVTISTDKSSYRAGETVNYTIEVHNGKYMWKLNSLKFEYSNSDGLIAASKDSMPNEIPVVAYNETYVLEGSVIGDEAVFPIGSDSVISSVTNENLSSVVLFAVVAIAIVIVVAVIIFFAYKKKKSAKNLLLIFLATSMFLIGLPAKAAEYEETTVRPYVEFEYGGDTVMIRVVLECHMLQERLEVSGNQVDRAKSITCHDPSIFLDFDGRYYVFGSFLATAYTDDLYDWVSIDSDFQATFSAETREQIRQWNKDGTSDSNWNGYLWAPDVIYNTAMGKYCMYLSANGDDWKSNIVLLTADAVTGPYEYAGSIVYSGFTAETIAETDALEVLGVDAIPERYVTNGIANRKWGDKWPNVIDPCVFYDEEGKLWMSYGSWSGGIFMLELDENSGLRDYSVSYETNEHSDAYFGKKIAGGAYVSGEASYIQYIGDYYYLFISYGNLEAAGGYNIRVFRSNEPDGEYLDEMGNSAFFDNYVFNYNLSVGIRLFGGYKWRNFNYGQVAGGHNSAFVDADGKAYIVYHTRTTNGSEGHSVKVHQLFVNKEGWLVAAPYQSSGETLKDSGFQVSDVAGEYELIIHELDIDYKALESKKPEFIQLEEDGTITGDYSGNWKLETGTPYITLVLDGETYSGLTLQMKIEDSTIETMVFTALGVDNQVTIWGSRMIE